MKPLIADAPHVFWCPLRWSDMDAAGHVHDVVYLRYLEEARIDMFYSAARTLGVAGLRDDRGFRPGWGPFPPARRG
ncbi:MAG: thioesterase family protein [Haloechinothrix sp.]